MLSIDLQRNKLLPNKTATSFVCHITGHIYLRSVTYHNQEKQVASNIYQEYNCVSCNLLDVGGAAPTDHTWGVGHQMSATPCTITSLSLTVRSFLVPYSKIGMNNSLTCVGNAECCIDTHLLPKQRVNISNMWGLYRQMSGCFSFS